MPTRRFPGELRLVLALATVVFLAASERTARAGDLIDVAVQTTDASPITINGAGSHIVDLTSDLVNDHGAVAPLAGRPFTATFQVGNLSNLLLVSSDAAGTTLTLSDPSTGQVKEFVGATKQAALGQVHSFLQRDLNSAFVGYQKRLNGSSGIGVTDGNPLAATAFLASDAFDRFGVDPTVPVVPIGQSGHFAIGFDAGGGEFRTNLLDGDFAKFDINVGARFCQAVGMVLSVPIEYRSIQGTDSYVGGMNLGFPITLHTHAVDKDGFAWQLTPWATVGGGINESLLSGGGIAGGGMTSSLGYHLGHFTFTMANQFGYDTGFDFPYDQYKFSTPVDQWIFKNGIYGAFAITKEFFVDAGASYTNFLHDAGVGGYVTPTTGLGFRWGHDGACDLRFSYFGDFGDGFSANGIQAQLHFSF